MPAYSPAHPSSNGLGPLPNVVAAIGHTPLIKLRKASELTGCTILAKAEFANPGGSIKDRTAKFIIEDAEAKRDRILDMLQLTRETPKSIVDRAVLDRGNRAGGAADGGHPRYRRAGHNVHSVADAWAALVAGGAAGMGLVAAGGVVAAPVGCGHPGRHWLHHVAVYHAAGLG